MSIQESLLPREPLDWRKANSHNAKVVWTDLREWVPWLCARYVLDHRTVPPCWYRHGSLVDVLTSLREAHRAAYDPSTSLGKTADWQLRLRDFEQRLTELTARTGCTRDIHRPDTTSVRPDDHVRWSEHLSADLERRSAGEFSYAVNQNPVG